MQFDKEMSVLCSANLFFNQLEIRQMSALCRNGQNENKHSRLCNECNLKAIQFLIFKSESFIFAIEKKKKCLKCVVHMIQRVYLCAWYLAPNYCNEIVIGNAQNGYRSTNRSFELNFHFIESKWNRNRTEMEPKWNQNETKI